MTAKLSSDVSTRERAAWQAITAFILLLGAVSCWTSSRAESWWNKDPEGVNPEIARIINRSEHPLIVSDDRMGALFSLSSVLQDKVQLLIEPRCYVCARTAIPPVLPQIPPQFSNVFFFRGGLEPGAYSEWLKELTEAGKAQPLLTQHGRVILWAVSRFSK